jgi:DNA-directed RNA polymerase subunit RPC12/RpoP
MLNNFLKNLKILETEDYLEKKIFENDDKIYCSTIHKSKGLEFPICFILKMNEKIYPLNFFKIISEYKSLEEHIEEERKILYTGINRCKNILFLTNSIFNEFGDNIKQSPFLTELDESLIEKNSFKKINVEYYFSNNFKTNNCDFSNKNTTKNESPKNKNEFLKIKDESPKNKDESKNSPKILNATKKNESPKNKNDSPKIKNDSPKINFLNNIEKKFKFNIKKFFEGNVKYKFNIENQFCSNCLKNFSINDNDIGEEKILCKNCGVLIYPMLKVSIFNEVEDKVVLLTKNILEKKIGKLNIGDMNENYFNLNQKNYEFFFNILFYYDNSLEQIISKLETKMEKKRKRVTKKKKFDNDNNKNQTLDKFFK